MTQLELGQEYIPPHEADAIAKVTQINERILNQAEKPLVRRGEHGKGHGCVRGTLVVDPQISTDPRLQVGLFKRNRPSVNFLS